VSHLPAGRRCSAMSATSEVVAAIKTNDAPFDLEAIFRAQYARMARVIGRVVHDPARAEELAVEVFLRLSRTPRAQSEKAEGWLYRTAVRIGLDELRREARRNRYERLAGLFRSVPTPEEIRAESEERERVRMVLSVMKRRRAELLLLRSDGLSYNEVAAALELNPASVGRLLIRAQEAFRKEYVTRYGEI
jgi:RNA polymerase sigma-70 factor (ECF subfamily)